MDGADVARRRVIYGLADPLYPGRIRYVGQSTQAPIARYLQHLVASADARGEWIAWLLECGRFPQMLLLETVDPTLSLRDRECWWIAALQDQKEADLNTPAPKADRELFEQERGPRPGAGFSFEFDDVASHHAGGRL